MITQSRGRTGEDIAVKYVQERGYRICARNYRCRAGEIDIICIDGEALVCVEVKFRSGDRYGDPYAFVGRGKIHRIQLAAMHFMQLWRMHARVMRIDVITIMLDNPNAVTKGSEIAHYKNITST